MTFASVDRPRQLDLARALVSKKLRTLPAKSLTGLSEAELRKLYRSLHGTSPSSGSIPSTAHLMTSRRRQLKLSAFLTIYQSLGSGSIREPIDAERLLVAHDLFSLIAGEGQHEIDLTGLWSVIREWRSGLTRLQSCPDCKAQYLVVPTSELPLNCPFCVLHPQRLSRN